MNKHVGENCKIPCYAPWFIFDFGAYINYLVAYLFNTCHTWVAHDKALQLTTELKHRRLLVTHRVKWRHGIYGHDTFAILWVQHDIVGRVGGEDLSCYSNKIQSVVHKEIFVWSLTCQQSAVTNVHQCSIITYNMAAKTSWHRYGTKLLHCNAICMWGFLFRLVPYSNNWRCVTFTKTHHLELGFEMDGQINKHGQ